MRPIDNGECEKEKEKEPIFHNLGSAFWIQNTSNKQLIYRAASRTEAAEHEARCSHFPYREKPGMPTQVIGG